MAIRTIFISKAVEMYFLRRHSFLSKRSLTVHYGIDVSIFDDTDSLVVQEYRNRFLTHQDGIIFGTVARLEPQKDLETLIHAYSHYKHSSSINLRLLLLALVLCEKILNCIAKYNIEDSVILYGFSDDIVNQSSFDIFCLSSIYEGFGLVLLKPWRLQNLSSQRMLVLFPRL